MSLLRCAVTLKPGLFRGLYLRLAVEACRDYETGSTRVVLIHQRQHVSCDAPKAGQVVC